MERKLIIERANQLESAINIIKKTNFPTHDETGLKKAEKHMLWLIATINQKKPVMPHEIAKFVGVTLAAITHHLNSLEDHDYIIRSTSKDDRRNTFITLTDKGKEMFEKIKKDKKNKICKLVEFLGDKDSLELVNIIAKISQFMAQSQKEKND